MCKLGDGNAFCQVSGDKANDIFAISPTRLVATTTIDTCQPLSVFPLISVCPVVHCHGDFVDSFPVCNLDYFYIYFCRHVTVRCL